MADIIICNRIFSGDIGETEGGKGSDEREREEKGRSRRRGGKRER